MQNLNGLMVWYDLRNLSLVRETTPRRLSMKARFVPIGLLLTIAVSQSSAAVTRIRDDMGGPLGRYLRMFATMRDSGKRVIIDGNCFSACTLVTIIPKERICITGRAVLGFHAGWVEDKTEKQTTNDE